MPRSGQGKTYDVIKENYGSSIDIRINMHTKIMNVKENYQQLFNHLVQKQCRDNSNGPSSVTFNHDPDRTNSKGSFTFLPKLQQTYQSETHPIRAP